MRHWERLSLVERRVARLLATQARLPGCVARPPRQGELARGGVGTNESSDFTYLDPRGDRALSRLAPVPSWHELQFPALARARGRLAAGPSSCPRTSARSNARSSEPWNCGVALRRPRALVRPARRPTSSARTTSVGMLQIASDIWSSAASLLLAIGVASQVVAWIILLAGGAAIGCGLVGSLDALGAGEQAARRNPVGDEPAVVRAPVERGRRARQLLCGEVVEETCSIAPSQAGPPCRSGTSPS